MQPSYQFWDYKKISEHENQVLVYDSVRDIFRLRSSSDPEYLSKEQRIFEHIAVNLRDCGKFYWFDVHCKKCEEENKNVVFKVDYRKSAGDKEKSIQSEIQKRSFLKRAKVQKHCGIRYCSKIPCIVDRFARTMDQLESIDRLKGLRKLFHFYIGFPKIDLEFFPEKRKEYERVLHDYFAELKRLGVTNAVIVDKKTGEKKKVFQGFKIMDISKGDRKKEWDGLYFLHYHIMAIPFSHADSRGLYARIQQARENVMNRQRVKIPFHVEISKGGNKKKEAMFSYIALRANGLFKSFESQKEKDFEKEELRIQLEKGKFMLMNQLFDVGRYVDLFYNKRFFSTLGGLPYGSKSPYNVSQLFDCKCRFHGVLSRSDMILRIEPVEDEKKPPDGLILVQDGEVLVDEKVEIEEIRIGVSDEDVERLLAMPMVEVNEPFDEYCNHCENHLLCLDGKTHRCTIKFERHNSVELKRIEFPGISYCSDFEKRSVQKNEKSNNSD